MSRHLLVEADGGSRANPGPAGYGALVRDPDSGFVYAERAGFLGVTTNNVAEYTGLVEGLRAAADIDPTAQVLVRMDSKLVVEQMSGRYKIKHPQLAKLAAEAKAAFDPTLVRYEWVPRARNADADALANEAMDAGAADPLTEPIVRDYQDWDVANSAGDRESRHISSSCVDGAVRAGITATTRSTGSGSPGLPETATNRSSSGTPPTSSTKPLPPPTAFHGLDPDEALTLVLVRHGVTELTMVGGLSGGGVPGPPLTAHGKTMAARAADAVYRLPDLWPDLQRPSRVLSSPMVRTQQTAAAIGRRLGKHVEVDDRLREIEFGEWESLTAPEVEARWPGEFRLWHSTGTFAPPGGESYADVGVRIAPVIEKLRNTDAGRAVVIVGHAAMIRAIVGPVLEIPPSHWGQIRVPPCSLTVLRYWPKTTELVTLAYPTGN